ncbi:MAG: mannitol dehydrogenase family protein [Rhizobiaceae bacterium]|nr:mannitol dehydrogenase family protein [Rhizobiaceae bacterium]
MGKHGRLSDLSDINPAALLPGYVPDQHKSGIVHLGPGAFHRAHQAAYTDAALAASGGDWRITAISLRSRQVADAMNAQNGLYTLIERGTIGAKARVIASIERVIVMADHAAQAMSALVDPATRIVSMTVTEKAYGIDRQNNCVDSDHPANAADLKSPSHPTGVIGLLVESLRQRRTAGSPAFTVLCCDNLPDNGVLVKAGVLDFARRIDPELADWIGDNATFPSTMVDRITPASSFETYSICQELTGQEDRACIETEEFSQWVIEDNFANGRPDWESAGALFVKDVAPFEKMKLRMLNGAHSMLAYCGYLADCTYVRDVMTHQHLPVLVARHMKAAAATLQPLGGIDYSDYGAQLVERFKNPALAHETYQIAMDGTEKLPQRLLLPAVDALQAKQDLRPFAFAVAAWMRYCQGLTDSGVEYDLRDPRQAEIAAKLNGAQTASDIIRLLNDLFPEILKDDLQWQETIEEIL